MVSTIQHGNCIIIGDRIAGKIHFPNRVSRIKFYGNLVRKVYVSIDNCESLALFINFDSRISLPVDFLALDLR
ncbi:hypothetical protein LEP1GSC047_0853 [Leptospira phage vB_LinZ_10-LE1]|nr:hypothetical protein LEP1GSC047_0853 [Leptospira phage vB_LinZ_10-LE1]